ncbi:transposable element Tc3 transposase [Trichonephila clavipes]|nr:transposable element Tc3 transposase [Trichonephila clavipes]
MLTNESRFCLQYDGSRIRVWRHRGERRQNCCVMRHYTGFEPGIMVWSGIGFHCRSPQLHIVGTLNSQRHISEVLEPVVLSNIQRLPSAIFQQDNADNTWHAMFYLPFRINCFLGLLVFPIYRRLKTYGLCFHHDWPGIQHPLLHQINFVYM